MQIEDKGVRRLSFTPTDMYEFMRKSPVEGSWFFGFNPCRVGVNRVESMGQAEIVKTYLSGGIQEHSFKISLLRSFSGNLGGFAENLKPMNESLELMHWVLNQWKNGISPAHNVIFIKALGQEVPKQLNEAVAAYSFKITLGCKI